MARYGFKINKENGAVITFGFSDGEFTYSSLDAMKKVEHIEVNFCNFLSKAKSDDRIVLVKEAKKGDEPKSDGSSDTAISNLKQAFNLALEPDAKRSLVDGAKLWSKSNPISFVSYINDTKLNDMVKSLDTTGLQKVASASKKVYSGNERTFEASLIALGRVYSPFDVKVNSDDKTVLRWNKTRGEVLEKVCDGTKFGKNSSKLLKCLCRGTMPAFDNVYKELKIDWSTDWSFVLYTVGMIGNKDSSPLVETSNADAIITAAHSLEKGNTVNSFSHGIDNDGVDFDAFHKKSSQQQAHEFLRLVHAANGNKAPAKPIEYTSVDGFEVAIKRKENKLADVQEQLDLLKSELVVLRDDLDTFKDNQAAEALEREETVGRTAIAGFTDEQLEAEVQKRLLGPRSDVKALPDKPIEDLPDDILERGIMEEFSDELQELQDV